MSEPAFALLLLVHVASALALVCVEAATLQGMSALRSAQDSLTARHLLSSLQRLTVLSRTAPLTLIGSGLSLAWLAGAFAAPWLILSMLGTALLAALVHVVELPRLQRFGQALQQHGGAGALHGLQRDSALRWSARIRFATLIWVFFLMLAKPALSVAALLGLVVCVVLLLPLALRRPENTALA
ncbi:hypothetical protein [Deinococcus humi]|uniref:Membrane protein YdbS with pleckstrin-like domain n=1 Tax=Deinococcus humi TaxID=662880 RepID=A0A7W8JTB4_9DEIO|nr:hypothetical protein [Deinococcus humi]MBB5362857.1 membrane protein YdbS with pleckstrin-like domain [Deinococcus humi]GGO25948.1 hypothetical protein GCM10008949_16230 [Deinococcus humi]